MKAQLLVAGAVFLGACVGQQDDPPCSAEGTCLPGFRCVATVCEPCEGESNCTPIPTQELGPGGGTVCTGMNCLIVPSGALPAFVSFELASIPRTSISGLSPLSDGLELRPASTVFDLDVEIELQVTGSTLTSDLWALYRADGPSGPWTRLDGNATASKARGLTSRAGVFVAARK